MSKPLLSIGIIFKNEIRCLERCLKSLTPLREMVPCELVMADTGSDDGSREVAAKYADILFDFPWVNDFAAARNAVMDRCSGDWYFSLDADEWLGGEIGDLAEFVQPGYPFQGVIASFTLYNYRTYALDDDHSEFVAYRLFRMSTGLRFEGAIHERWPYEKTGLTEMHTLSRVILHHDGYVGLNEETGRPKRERNLALLRQAMGEKPNDLRTQLQWLESGIDEPDFVKQLKRGMQLVRSKQVGWKLIGPPLFRLAVIIAYRQKLPELEDWIKETERRFPNSLFTRVDVEFVNFAHAWDSEDYAKCIAVGEPCLQTLIDLREGRISKDDLRFGTLQSQGRPREQELILYLADAFRLEKQPKKCVEYLKRVEYQYLNEIQTQYLTHILIDLHTQSDEDTVPLVAAVWEGIQRPLPSQKRARERRTAFLQEASTEFQKVPEERQRPGYTLFLPLADRCEVGRAAQIMELNNARAQEEVLAQVERWNELPIQALAYALDCGVRFPLPDKPMQIEEMDELVGRLAPLGGLNVRISQPEQHTDNSQSLCWRRALLLAAIRDCKWENTAQGLSLARAFAEMERQFLPLCYSDYALTETGLSLMPPMHRFGWYCAQAFDALDAGDAAAYVRLLRKGLGVCENMKEMAQFLLEHTPELHRPEPSAELNALAGQIKSVLSSFAPDDPAVAALKQSEAYRKVAHLIEGMEAAAAGGQMR